MIQPQRQDSELTLRTIDTTQSFHVPGCNMLPCKMTRTQKFILVSLCLLKFVALASFSVIAPFFPLEASAKRVPEVVIGVVFTVYAATNFLSSPFFGRIIADIGPKIVLLTGTGVLGVSSLLFGILESVQDAEKFAILSVAVRIFEGIGCGAAGTAIFTYIAEVFPRRTGIIMGVMEVMTGVGLSTGPALGGYLYSVGGYKTPFTVLGLICLGTIPVNCFLLPRRTPNDTRDIGPNQNVRSPKGRKRVSKWRLMVSFRFLVAALSTSSVSCGTAFLSPLLEPHLRKLGMSPTQSGLMFLFTPIVYGLVSPISGMLSDENPPWRRLQTSFGLVFVGVAFLIIGPSPLFYPLKKSLWLVILGLCVKGLGSTFALVPTFQIMLDTAKELGIEDNLATHSMISGLWSSSWSFGEIIGPLLGTLVESHFGFRWATTCVGFFAFLMAILMAITHCLNVARKKKMKNVTTTETDELVEPSADT